MATQPDRTTCGPAPQALLRRAALALGMALVGIGTAPAQTTYSQLPLLGNQYAVPPNILLILDDSLSMLADYVFRPFNLPANWGGGVMQGDLPKDTNKLRYAICSPQLNSLYYNPQRRYLPGNRADGTFAPVTAWKASTTDTKADYFETNGLRTECLGKAGGKSAPYVNMLRPGATQWHLASSYDRKLLAPGASPLVVPRPVDRTDCANASGCTQAEELANFNIWFTFYRTRMQVARLALAQGFLDVTPDVRVGWGELAPMSGVIYDPASKEWNYAGTRSLKMGVAPLRDDQRTRLYNWIGSVGANGNGTPLRTALDTAGRYFKRTDSNGPWGTTPDPLSIAISAPAVPASKEMPSEHSSCRRSHTVEVTDGDWNSDDIRPLVGNADGTPGPLITGPRGGKFAYTPDKTDIYADSASNTLADVAMTYWAQDLRPDLPNVAGNGASTDPPFWQNMSFSAISLGLFGSMSATTATLAQIRAGKITWPRSLTESEADTLGRIDDLWHATLNGRGSYFNALNGQELAAALSEAINRMVMSSGEQTGLTSAEVSVPDGASVTVYSTRYIQGPWTGNVLAQTLNTTELGRSTYTWTLVDTQLPASGTAADRLGPSGTRTITFGVTGGTAKALPFNLAQLSGSGALGRMALPPRVDAKKAVDALRGDTTLTGPGTAFRARKARLGDVVNSTPAYIGGWNDMGYAKLPAALAKAAAGYPAFLTAKRSRRPALAFGANDGMLHIIDAATGRELMAYIPWAVLPTIGRLLDRSYTHQYYVDGPMSVSDFVQSGNWSEALIGTTGMGPPAVFALDVTKTDSLAAGSVLWEITPQTKDFADLGHVTGEVRTGVTPDGKWVALFGNGFGSAGGRSVLYVVNLATGEQVQSLTLDAGLGQDQRPRTDNGAGGVGLVLDPTTNAILAAYVGDLNGHVWRVDLETSATTSTWVVGNGKKPVFSVAQPGKQPITAAPLSVPHPQGGRMVVFGTGQLMNPADVNSSTAQQTYGIWDKGGTSRTVLPENLRPSSVQVQQTATTVAVSAGQTMTQTVTFYAITSTVALDWKKHDGWVLSLPDSGQRVLRAPAAIVDDVIQLDSLVPDLNSGKGFCEQTVRNATYYLNPLSGTSPARATLDTTGDKQVVQGTDTNSDLYGVSGLSTDSGGRMSTIQLQLPRGGVEGVVLNQGLAIRTFFKASSPPPGTGSSMRRSWRQLFSR